MTQVPVINEITMSSNRAAVFLGLNLESFVGNLLSSKPWPLLYKWNSVEHDIKYQMKSYSSITKSFSVFLLLVFWRRQGVVLLREHSGVLHYWLTRVKLAVVRLCNNLHLETLPREKGLLRSIRRIIYSLVSLSGQIFRCLARLSLDFFLEDFCLWSTGTLTFLISTNSAQIIN